MQFTHEVAQEVQAQDLVAVDRNVDTVTCLILTAIL